AAQSQAAQGQPNPTPAAARPLEVVPLPFLRADSSAPATSPNSQNATQTAQANPTPTSAAAQAPARPSLPPNPFAPLISENQTPPTTATASAVPATQGPGSPPIPSAASPTRIPTQQSRVVVSQPQAGLPRIPGLTSNRPTPTVTGQTPRVTVTTTRPSQGQNSGVRTNAGTALPRTNNLNTGTAQSSAAGNANTSSTPPATALVRPGGTVRLTPGGSANAAPSSITPGTGALPIRIAPLERELASSRPAAVIETPTTPPVVETPAAQPTQQPLSAPVEAVETPSVGALDIEGAGPQSSFSPDFTQVQPGGRTTPRPEIRGTTAQPPRPQTQQQPQQQTQPQQQQQQQTPQQTQTTEQTTTVAVAPPNPIEDYVKAQNLRLANVVLGSTNVAIFQSRDGFLVLPVGSTLPNSEILIRSLNAREALLVQGSTELNLPVQNP
ncbi:MAG: hypothetical protein SFU83_05125, partial [Meiothermus sp.]|nr:hypothetical protein [Meiothermus sp.]